MHRTAMLLALAVPALIAAAPKEVDKPGCQDHPLFTRMPGYYLSACKTEDFDNHKFPVEGPARFEVIEGKKTTLTYKRAKATSVSSPLELLRNHLQAIRQAGGEVLRESSNTATMRLKKGSTEVWAMIHNLAANGSFYSLTIVERGQMVQKISASAMLDGLNRDGFIALDIHFDTNKATIQADSEAQIQEIADMLKANPKLRVSVDGHTDNTGTPEGNRKLSDERAKAVKAALVARGISAERLQAKGFGQDKPVADNRTEEGRAKNRRVELVKL